MTIPVERPHRRGDAECRTVPGQGTGGLPLVETTAGRSGLEQVLRIWNELDVPEGLRVVQVTLEGVLMTLAPGPRHRNTVEELHRVLVAALEKT
ncbi:hypothetical protein GCM10022223_65570 [Kineosporia mesophila]|uniref:Restriction endonuclease domain-containing protein n=1 Tax=Kineosporia mesophila TaxID=566012 RepID=A0ABP7AQ46_9ACTN|nr:hypothetical protein [Kineosporia mesophila]MCD5349191.1 hypothetical protein [Kineosporia mesophila]